MLGKEGLMRAAAVTIGVMLGAAILSADDRSITFDKNVDFLTFKSFAVHDVKIVSSRPELSNSLFATQIGDAIRKGLTAKGLTETSDRPDLFVDSSVTGVDYSIGSAGRANAIPPGRSPPSFAPVSFTEGTLVIDLTAREPAKLVWHGVYRRPRDSAAKLAEKLPDQATRLLLDYPPKKKK
jgi:hypothetical protein